MRKLTLVVVLSTAFATTAMANEMPETGLIEAQQVFHMEDAQPMQLAVLSEQEMRETEGAVWWFAPIVGWTVGGGITGVASIVGKQVRGKVQEGLLEPALRLGFIIPIWR